MKNEEMKENQEKQMIEFENNLSPEELIINNLIRISDELIKFVSQEESKNLLKEMKVYLMLLHTILIADNDKLMEESDKYLSELKELTNIVKKEEKKDNTISQYQGVKEIKEPSKTIGINI